MSAIESDDWQRELANATRDAASLFKRLGLDESELDHAQYAARDFRLLATESYISRMRHGDANDPLLLQVLPQAAELIEQPGFVSDPCEDLPAAVTPGLLHKYRGRALLVATGACAVHCRYCFRRHFPYQDENPASGDWNAALNWLQQAEDIHEVILSGGDPLVLADRKLTELLHRLEQIPHLDTLRIHTRLPIVLPSRVNVALCRTLKASRLNCVVVLHANHANEIDSEVEQACAELRTAGATLLNQSVLLAAINDDEDSLVALSKRLFEVGALPYYLHQLDKVQGSAHFQVSDSKAKRLMRDIHARLPGYLLPRLVQEVPGQSGKTPITWQNTP